MNIAAILETAKAPALARTARYMARVDEHLLGFSTVGAKLAFLNAEHEKWIERYRAWALRVDDGTASEADLTQSAWDYTETLAALSIAIGRFEKAA